MLSRINHKFTVSSNRQNTIDENFELGQLYLGRARECKDKNELEQASALFSKAKAAFKKAKPFNEVTADTIQRLLGGTYLERGDVLRQRGLTDKANDSYGKAEKCQPGLAKEKLANPTILSSSSSYLDLEQNLSVKKGGSEQYKLMNELALMSLAPTSTGSLTSQNNRFFLKDDSSTLALGYPLADKVELTDIIDTQYLARCLQQTHFSNESEKKLMALAKDILEIFAQRKTKMFEQVLEIVPLATVPNARLYRQLVNQLAIALNDESILNLDVTQGLAVVIRNCPQILFDQRGVSAGDLVAVLDVLKNRLVLIHQNNNYVQLRSLLETFSYLLDAMVQTGLAELDRKRLLEPLNNELEKILEQPIDQELAYQVRYVCQALAHISNNEDTWQTALRNVFNIGSGLASLSGGVINALKLNIEPGKFIEAFQFFKAAWQDLGQKWRGRQNTWYLALRFADLLLEAKQWAKFEYFSRNNSDCQEKNFLLGLCPRLEQIAHTQTGEVREGAIRFLKDLSGSEKQAVQLSAQAAINRLDQQTIKSQHEIILSVRSPIWQTAPGTQLLKEALLKHKQDALWQREIIPAAELGKNIQELKSTYLKNLDAIDEIREARALYVKLRGTTLANTAESFDLEEKIDEFLKSEKRVLLLLGKAGSGKSTFNRHLAQRLWHQYRGSSEADETPIPLFISLSTLREPTKNLIASFLQEQGFSGQQIETLRTTRRFIFILDGYDEIAQRDSLFYADNRLNEWKAQIIVSSRPEYLNPGYERQFCPLGQPRLLQVYQLAPFSDKEFELFISKYKAYINDPTGSAINYEKAFETFDLRTLAKTPFQLKMVLDVLSAPSAEGSTLGQNGLTQLALYGQFLMNWFARSEERLKSIQLTSSENDAYKFLVERGGFTQLGIGFSQKLAVAMYEKQAVVATLDVLPEYANLFSDDEKMRLLRLNAPLIREGHQYRFLHKSLQDYLVASAVWGELGRAQEQVSQNALLNRLNLVKEPTALEFLVERVKQVPLLENYLLNWVEHSKLNQGFEMGAANALTILVKAGVQFNRSNFNGIKVPGADLSYGVFDGAQFERANLSNIQLCGAWLRGANMRDATLSGVEFGETPALEIGTEVYVCSYSLDGQWLAVGAYGGKGPGYHIQVYEAKTKKLKSVLQNPDAKKYYSVAFSPNGKWLVAGDSSQRISLWDINSSELQENIISHEGEVYSIAFSPNNQWLVSGSSDQTIKLWKVQDNGTFAFYRTLNGHSGGVRSVSISRDGGWLVSGSIDATIKLWTLEEGRASLFQTLDESHGGHSGPVRSVCFSLDGATIASGSTDETVKLWSLTKTGALLSQTLKGGDDPLLSVSLSADNKWVVAGGLSGGVALWGLESSKVLPYQRLDGHSDMVSSVCISPDGRELVSGALDGMVKLWPLENPRVFPQPRLKGHSAGVLQMSFASQGRWLASASYDRTVKLWKVGNKEAALEQTLEGHKERVSNVSLSSDGQWLVSGDMNGVLKVWKREENSGMVLQRTLNEGSHNMQAAVAIFSNDRWLASSGGEIVVMRLQALADGEELPLQTVSGHSDVVACLSSSPDGELIASGSYDQTVKVWQPDQKGDQLSEFFTLEESIGEEHSRVVYSVSIAPGCAFMASATADGMVNLWKPDGTEMKRYMLKGHKDAVYSVSISPNGEWVASGGGNNTIMLWSSDTHECKVKIQGDIGYFITSIVWLESGADSMKIALGGADTAIRIFQLEKKEESWKSYLWWTSYQSKLSVDGLSIQGARGLSPDNANLLRQKGAVMQLH